jgi:hypothetical protein
MRVLFQFEKAPTADLLLLASFSSRAGVMEALLDEMQREVLSRDSNDHCVLRFHELHLLDDDRHVCTWPDGSFSKAGLTAFGELVAKAQKQENQKRLLTHPTVLGLMYCKWDRYAKRVFAIEFSLYLMLVLSMSAGLVIRTGSGTVEPGGSTGLLLMVLEAVALGAAALLLAKWWAEQSAASLEREHILGRAVALLNILLPIVGIASAWLGEGQDSTTLSVNAFAIVFLWLGLVKYLESSRTVGAFFVTVRTIVRKDLLVWSGVLVVFFPGLSLGVSLLTQASRGDEFMKEFTPWHNALFTQWLVMFGLYDWPRSNDAPLTAVMVATGALMLNVMAVNMLIAMMNSTYAQVQKRGEQEWACRWSRYVLQCARWAPWVGVARSATHVLPGDAPFEWQGAYGDVFIAQPEVERPVVLGLKSSASLSHEHMALSRAEEEQVRRLKETVGAAVAPLNARLERLEELLLALVGEGAATRAATVKISVATAQIGSELAQLTPAIKGRGTDDDVSAAIAAGEVPKAVPRRRGGGGSDTADADAPLGEWTERMARRFSMHSMVADDMTDI